jgi:hypothetical protein
MIRRAHLLAATALVKLSLAGCGGKVAGDDSATLLPDGGRTGPTPTCDAICAHIVGTCAPGASTGPCVADCEDGQARFVMTRCASLLDTYLRCMSTTCVECDGTNIVVLDCSDERNQLDECHP